MVSEQTVCLRRLAGSRAREVRFGRWLANDNVTPEILIAHAATRTGVVAAGRHVLAIQDTTELNYQAHARQVSGLGTVGNGSDAGLFLHPLLAVDATEGTCLGLAHVHHWIRTTRACRDRTLATGGTLYPWIDAQPVRGVYHFDAPARPGQRSAHQARLSVRFGEVTIKRPTSCTDKTAPTQIALRFVEVRELPDSVVGDEAPIHWRLLTTHRVECLEDALRCVDWYRQRWTIEQLFRTLKKQGLDMESSQVETGEGLTKLACMALQAAVRTLQLTLARDGGNSAQAADVFTPDEVELLQRLQPTLEGKTEKQKNPHGPGSLAQAAWVVARLGGWKGYASEAKPGPITMLHGLQRLAAICQGWKLATNDVCID